MRNLITMALMGSSLALAMSIAPVRAATNVPYPATNPTQQTNVQTISSGSKGQSPSELGAISTSKVAGVPPTPAPAAVTGVSVQLISKAELFYPRNELYEKMTGCVVLAGTFGEDGYPLVLSIARSRPQGIFDPAALAAARGFRIRITDRKGHPLNARTLREVRLLLPIVYWIPGATPTEEQLSYMCAPLMKRVLIVSAASATAPQKITIRPAAKVRTSSPIVSSSPRAEQATLQTLASDFVTMPVPKGKTLRSGWVRVGFCIGADGHAT